MRMEKCPRCKREIVRRVEEPLPGELTRVSWDCKCEVAHGTAVVWLPQGNVTVRGRLVAR